MIAEADRAYKIEDAAERLGKSKATVYRLIENGHLKKTEYPGITGWVITSRELARFLDSCQKAA